MRKMGLAPIYQAPRTSRKHPHHRVYPYLLRGMTIDRPNQVWCADITYIPIRGGFLYLVAIMDWHSRKVLSWRLSNTMEASFCVEALEDAFAHHGVPEIINTDQGSQFTAMAWIEAVKTVGARISMDSKGRWMDNVFIERLWRSLKYECVYLHVFETGSEARSGIGHWMNFYNTQRPHSTLDGRTPREAYNSLPMQAPDTGCGVNGNSGSTLDSPTGCPRLGTTSGPVHRWKGNRTMVAVRTSSSSSLSTSRLSRFRMIRCMRWVEQI